MLIMLIRRNCCGIKRKVSAMNQLWLLVHREIKFYLKSKIFWLLGSLAIMTAFLPSLNVLMIQFMVINTVTRDERANFSIIFATLPYSTAKLWLARAMAVFFLLLAIWPLIVLVLGFLIEIEPAEWLLNCQHFGLLMLKYITLCLASIGFVFLCSLFTRRLWKLYLIVGIGWLFEVYFTSNLSHFPSWITLIVFGHGEMGLTAPSTAFGYFLQPDLFLFYVFQIASSIFLVLGVVLYHMAKRSEQILHCKLVSVFLIWLMIASCAGVTFYRENTQREREFCLGLQEIQELEAVTTKASAVKTPVLESYDLKIKLHTVSHSLEGKAILKLKLPNIRSKMFFFTLRNYFKVTDVVEAETGKKLEWRRYGSYLTVSIPEYQQRKTLKLGITYSGQVWEWFDGLAHPTGPVNFVTPSFSLLRSGYAWYPVPGVHPLYRRKYYAKPWDSILGANLWAKHARHPSVPFSLTVDLDSDSSAVTNLEWTGRELLTGEYKQRYKFVSLHGRDVFLMTGPFYHEKREIPNRQGFLNVYCYRQHQSKITGVVNSLTEPYLFFQRILLPDRVESSKIGTVVEIPAFFFFQENGIYANNLTLTDTVLIPEQYFRTGKQSLSIFAGPKRLGFREILYNIAILQRWEQDDATHENGKAGVISGLGLYRRALYMEKINGRAYYNRYLLIEGIDDVPIARDVFLTLDAIRSSKLGDKSINKLMGFFFQIYNQTGAIYPKTFIKVINTMLEKANLTQEKKKEIRRRLKSIAQYIDETRPQKIRSSVMLYPFNREWL